MIEIIPAIDIMNGKCVRLVQGDFARKQEYNSDPLTVAQAFEDAGIRRLHLVDLDGARIGKIMHPDVLEKIARQTRLAIDFSGGIRTDDDIRAVFGAGAAMVSIGSLAYLEPAKVQQWKAEYGADQILIGMDVRHKMIAVKGWLQQTNMSVKDFINNYQSKGFANFFCTDILKDGLNAGASFDLYAGIIEVFPEINLIASGGVRNVQDIIRLQRVGCKGVIIGKALYEGRIKLMDLKPFIN